MIFSLTINNIALIDRVEIEFSDGLNVLSGETGAGKSIIVDSMNLILGERAGKELIRNGESKARVQAVIYADGDKLNALYDEFGIEKADELIISRELSIDGRNICRINGSAVNLNTLKAFTDLLIDIHGQHEHQYLLRPKTHIGMLDKFAGESAAKIKADIEKDYTLLKDARRRLKGLGGSADEIAKTLELLRFQKQEITAANIRQGEETELKEELETMLNAEKISSALSSCYEALYDGAGNAYSSVSAAMRGLEGISGYSAKYEELSQRLGEAYYIIEDAAHEARELAMAVNYDQNRVAELEERIDLIFDLKRKYGGSEEAILAFGEGLDDKIFELENSDKTRAELEGSISNTKKRLYALYLKLSDTRRKAAADLEKRITTELFELGMQGSRFSVQFADIPAFSDVSYTRDGADSLEFYMSANPGEPQKPLSKIASGGEVSRIMLAFKNVFAAIDDIDTLIFDEIDTGISGRIARVVGEKLARVSCGKQVICVTHLPQIAAMADKNYLIEKSTAKASTKTSVTPLDENGKMLEISRLSGGDASEVSIEHAKSMAQKADEYKNTLKKQ